MLVGRALDDALPGHRRHVRDPCRGRRSRHDARRSRRSPTRARSRPTCRDALASRRGGRRRALLEGPAARGSRGHRRWPPRSSAPIRATSCSCAATCCSSGPPCCDVLSSSPRRGWLLQHVLPELLPWRVDDAAVRAGARQHHDPSHETGRSAAQAHALVVAKAALDRLLGFGPPFEDAARSGARGAGSMRVDGAADARSAGRAGAGGARGRDRARRRAVAIACGRSRISRRGTR